MAFYLHEGRFFKVKLFQNKCLFVFRNCKAFFESVKSKSLSFNKIEKHFQEIGFNYTEVFQEWTMNFYTGYLSFSVKLLIFQT